jgi:hypothetical protein
MATSRLSTQGVQTDTGCRHGRRYIGVRTEPAGDAAEGDIQRVGNCGGTLSNEMYADGVTDVKRTGSPPPDPVSRPRTKPLESFHGPARARTGADFVAVRLLRALAVGDIRIQTVAWPWPERFVNRTAAVPFRAQGRDRRARRYGAVRFTLVHIWPVGFRGK